MKINVLIGLAALQLIMATHGSAAPINLDFSISGLSGTFFGLDNADGVSSASSVVFTGGFDSYSFDTAGSASNQFTFLASSLTDLVFSDAGPHIGLGGNSSLVNFNCTLDNCITSEQTIPFGAFFDVPMSTPIFTQQSVSAVPLPASGVFLLSVLIGLAGVRRRKKDTASLCGRITSCFKTVLALPVNRTI